MKLHFVFLLALAFGVGCSPSDSNPATSSKTEFTGTHPIHAIATVGMVADIVRNVGREHVQVQQLMGSGVDPHLYKTTRDDIQSIINSDIVFYCGLMLEGKMADTLVKVGRKKPVFAVTELIEESRLLEPDDFVGHFDPHVWMDVSAWTECVDSVADALVEFDPTHSDDYRANANEYRKRLQELHQYGIDSIGSIPESRRVLITSHDAFNYFGRAYGLEVRGVQGISTESEAGLQSVNELVDLIVSKKIEAVFVESSVSQKNIEALIEGANAKGHSLEIGGELFSDAMGETGLYEGTYIGMLDHNITLATRALGGIAPERGMQNKLTPSRGEGH